MVPGPAETRRTKLETASLGRGVGSWRDSGGDRRLVTEPVSLQVRSLVTPAKEACMAQIQVQGVVGDSNERAQRAKLSLFPARTRNGPDENQAAEKLPMP